MENHLFDKYKEVFEFGREHSKKEAVEILERSIANCYGNPEGGILDVGINPSCSDFVAAEGFDEDKFKYNILQDIVYKNVKKGIWKNFYDLYVPCFQDKVVYLDLFPIRCTHQKQRGVEYSFEDIFENEIDLKVKLLTITQKEIERLNPKVIVIHNKLSFAYWGGLEKFVWMGYVFEPIVRDDLSKRIKIFRIKGMRNEEGQIIPNLETNLTGKLVVYYGLYRYLKKEERQNDVVQIIELIKSELENELLLSAKS